MVEMFGKLRFDVGKGTIFIIRLKKIKWLFNVFFIYSYNFTFRIIQIMAYLFFDLHNLHSSIILFLLFLLLSSQARWIHDCKYSATTHFGLESPLSPKCFRSLYNKLAYRLCSVFRSLIDFFKIFSEIMLSFFF